MGLGNIERRIRNDSAYKRKEAELLVDKLEMMVTNIEKMKEDLKKIEKENKKEILENRDFYQKISKIRENMGLPKELGVYEWRDKPSIKERFFGGDFYNELSHELLDLIVENTSRTGGILALSELVLLLNKSRPGKNLEHQDILKGIKILLKKKLIDNLLELENGMKIIEVKEIDWSEEQKLVLDLGSELGYMTIENLMIKTGWGLQKINSVLLDMEKNGLVLKDVSAVEGIKYWFPGLQTN